MKKIFLLLIICIAFNVKAQYYAFSKSTGTYSYLTGSTIIDNSAWSAIEKGVKIPFAFKYWGIPVTDSIYLDEFGAASLNDSYDDEIGFLICDLDNRGAGKSPVSYKVEGTAPNRILKIEYRNVGFNVDLTFEDSANVQCWLYETSEIIEFRYGPSSVSASVWNDNLAIVGIVNPTLTKFLLLCNDPSNPNVVTNQANFVPLNAMPANGTVYKFTPSPTSGIDKVIVKINIAQNKISVPASVEVKSVKIYNVNGQLVQSATKTEDINLALLNKGLYVVMIETTEGLLTQKLLF